MGQNINMQAGHHTAKALAIDTFSNVRGGNSLFKALGHPLAANRAGQLAEELSQGSVALYDPFGHYQVFAELYDTGRWQVTAAYVQDAGDLNRRIHDRDVELITALSSRHEPDYLLIAAFDAQRLMTQIAHLVPAGTRIVSFDDLQLPDSMLTLPNRYLNPLNFATNFAFLRDAGGLHTRITLCNYWSGYGARQPELWLCLFDEHGTRLAEWRETQLVPAGTVSIDSKTVRARFDLDEFAGTLFIHAIGVAGHDVIKYALDTYGDSDTELSCTHDANSWPADYYAGLPAPEVGEQVVLWIQNSHPVTIPAGAVRLNIMGEDNIRPYESEIPPFATVALDVGALFPEARWPAQLEVIAGKYFVRPRYEVISQSTGRRIAHANVERVDLAPDPDLRQSARHLGKAYILPAPILPREHWETEFLPTPMARSQHELALTLICYDPEGQEVARRALGRLPRNGCPALSLDDVLGDIDNLPENGGHMELMYDLDQPDDLADGWLHALFRYRHRASGHVAESSFGAHIYNIPVTYKGEPQSYAGPPPGLSTRLFLRLGDLHQDTLCHLIYPCSDRWHPQSQTTLRLFNAKGESIAQRDVRIACGGSLFWRYSTMFGAEERKQAGSMAYIMVQDSICRLFGFHGLANSNQAFSLDHMFGF